MLYSMKAIFRYLISSLIVLSLSMSLATAQQLNYWFDELNPSIVVVQDLGVEGEYHDIELGVDLMLDPGLHVLYLSTLYNGELSPIKSVLFCKTPEHLTDTSEEGFFDIWLDDPNGPKLLSLNARSGLNTLSLDLSRGEREGLHQLYVRYRSKSGLLSPLKTYLYMRMPKAEQKGTTLRFWFDDDTSTVSLLPVKGSIEEAFECLLPCEGLSEGVHRLTMQVQEPSGRLSLNRSLLFFKTASVTEQAVYKLLYYFDGKEEELRTYTFDNLCLGGEFYDISLLAGELAEGEHTITVVPINKHEEKGLASTTKFTINKREEPKPEKEKLKLSIKTLDPNPNIDSTDKLMEYAKLKFYYRIFDEASKPLSGVKIKCSFADQILSSEASNEQGLCIISIDTKDYLNLGEESTLHFLEVEGFPDKEVEFLTNDFSDCKVHIAYPYHRGGMEMKLEQGFNLGSGQVVKWSIAPKVSGAVGLTYAPDASVSGATLSHKRGGGGSLGAQLLKFKKLNVGVEGTLFGEWETLQETEATPVNALAAVDVLSRGISGPAPLASWLYAQSRNLYLRAVRNKQVAYDLEVDRKSVGFRLNGQLSAFKMGVVNFGSTKFKDLLPDFELSPGFEVVYQDKDWGYVGPSNEELESSRNPEGRASLKFMVEGDLGKRLFSRSLTCLYNGSENVFRKNHLNFLANSLGLDPKFSVESELSQENVYNRNMETELPLLSKTSWEVKAQLDLSKELKQIDLDPLLDQIKKQSSEDKPRFVGLTLGSAINYKHTRSTGFNLLMYLDKFGEEELNDASVPFIRNGDFKLFSTLSSFFYSEEKINKAWKAMIARSNNKNPLPTMNDLYHYGYRLNSTVSISVPMDIRIPILPYFSVDQGLEAEVAYAIGPSYYHPEAEKLIEPLKYDFLRFLADKPSKVLTDAFSGLSDIVKYLVSSAGFDDWSAEDSKYEVAWAKAPKTKENGMVRHVSSERKYLETLRAYDQFKATPQKNVSVLEVSYPDDGSVFSPESEVELLSVYPAGEVYGVTSKQDTILLVSDVYQVRAKEGGKLLKTTGSAPMQMKASVGKDDLFFLSLAEDAKTQLYYSVDGKSEWIAIGSVDEAIEENRLGYYAIAVGYKRTDVTAPSVEVSYLQNEAELEVKVSDDGIVKDESLLVIFNGEEIKMLNQGGGVYRYAVDQATWGDLKVFDVFVLVSDVSNNSYSSHWQIANEKGEEVEPVTVEHLQRVDAPILYPNPASGYAYIQTRTEELGRLWRLYSSTGMLCLSGRIDQLKMRLDLCSLLSGTYFFHIEGEKNVQKFILNND